MMKVEIAFDLAANGLGSFFTLDDPVKGKLDNTLYVLGGDVLVDVTNTVRQVSVKRGRNRQLEKFTAGNANLVLDNRNRIYDPLNTASPYFGSIVPRKQVTISDEGQVIYTGQVADWNFDYSLSGDSTAQVSCVDALALLVDPFLTADTETAQLTGARVNAVLDDVGWPIAQRQVSEGKATLDADVIEADKTQALDYLNKVSLSEPGALYVANNGDLVFRDRADTQNASGSITFGTGGIPFSDIGVEYGVEEMANQVSVTYYGGTAIAGTATARNETSIGQYGTLDENYDTLLSSASDAQSLADWQVGLFAQPRYRVDRITVALDALTTPNQQSVLAVELGDVVTVTWTPNNVGAALSQLVTIDGIDFAGNPSSRRISFTMSETTAAFILNDPVFGVLGNNLLGF
jgi:hypothetical protein